MLASTLTLWEYPWLQSPVKGQFFCETVVPFAQRKDHYSLASLDVARSRKHYKESILRIM